MPAGVADLACGDDVFSHVLTAIAPRHQMLGSALMSCSLVAVELKSLNEICGVGDPHQAVAVIATPALFLKGA